MGNNSGHPGHKDTHQVGAKVPVLDLRHEALGREQHNGSTAELHTMTQVEVEDELRRARKKHDANEERRLLAALYAAALVHVRTPPPSPMFSPRTLPQPEAPAASRSMPTIPTIDEPDSQTAARRSRHVSFEDTVHSAPEERERRRSPPRRPLPPVPLQRSWSEDEEPSTAEPAHVSKSLADELAEAEGGRVSNSVGQEASTAPALSLADELAQAEARQRPSVAIDDISAAQELVSGPAVEQAPSESLPTDGAVPDPAGAARALSDSKEETPTGQPMHVVSESRLASPRDQETSSIATTTGAHDASLLPVVVVEPTTETTVVDSVPAPAVDAGQKNQQDEEAEFSDLGAEISELTGSGTLAALVLPKHRSVSLNLATAGAMQITLEPPTPSQSLVHDTPLLASDDAPAVMAPDGGRLSLTDLETDAPAASLSSNAGIATHLLSDNEDAEHDSDDADAEKRKRLDALKNDDSSLEDALLSDTSSSCKLSAAGSDDLGGASDEEQKDLLKSASLGTRMSALLKNAPAHTTGSSLTSADLAAAEQATLNKPAAPEVETTSLGSAILSITVDAPTDASLPLPAHTVPILAHLGLTKKRDSDSGSDLDHSIAACSLDCSSGDESEHLENSVELALRVSAIMSKPRPETPHKDSSRRRSLMPDPLNQSPNRMGDALLGGLLGSLRAPKASMSVRASNLNMSTVTAGSRQTPSPSGPKHYNILDHMGLSGATSLGSPLAASPRDSSRSSGLGFGESLGLDSVQVSARLSKSAQRALEVLRNDKEASDARKKSPLATTDIAIAVPPPPPPAPPPPPPPPKKDVYYADDEEDAVDDTDPFKGWPAVYRHAGEKEGVLAWRIELMHPVPVPENEVGTFHVGDSYVILQTVDDGQLSHRVFFWVGEESSRDEYTTACFQASTLAKLTHAKVTREDQGSESAEFKKAFWFGLKLAEGGVASALKHVTQRATAMLYEIKGVKFFHAVRVEPKWTSLSRGEVFVLDCNDIVYQWNGAGSSIAEKGKALDFTSKLRQERGGNVTVKLLHSNNQSDEENAPFWKTLGCLDGRVPEIGEKPGLTDKEFEQELLSQVKLFEVSNASGELEVLEIDERPLRKKMLTSSEVYVVDSRGDVFVWIGKDAEEGERIAGLKCAEHFFESKVRSDYAVMTRVVEGAETYLFKENFVDWTEPVFKPPPKAVPRIAKPPTPSVDYSALYAHAFVEDEEAIPDVGEGITTVMIFESDKVVFTLAPPYVGHFFMADAAVVIRLFSDASGQDYVTVYFWQGRDADQNVFLFYDLTLGRKLRDQFGGSNAILRNYRVFQHKEPAHLLSLFPSIVVHEGHARAHLPVAAQCVLDIMDAHQDLHALEPSALWNVKELNAERAQQRRRLFQVRCEASDVIYRQPRDDKGANTTAYEVSCDASVLNSGDAFILVDCEKRTLFVWLGVGINRFEVELSQEAARMIRRVARRPISEIVAEEDAQEDETVAEDEATEWPVTTVPEGHEGEDFWAAIGGRKSYADYQQLKDSDLAVFLYKANFSTGQPVLSEVHHFAQGDLESGFYFVLDAGSHVYVRTPAGAEEAKVAALERAAQEYVASDPVPSRRAGVVVTTVRAGHEPREFSCHFHAWHHVAHKDFVDPRLAREQKLEVADAGRSPSGGWLTVTVDNAAPQRRWTNLLDDGVACLVDQQNEADRLFFPCPAWRALSRDNDTSFVLTLDGGRSASFAAVADPAAEDEATLNAALNSLYDAVKAHLGVAMYCPAKSISNKVRGDAKRMRMLLDAKRVDYRVVDVQLMSTAEKEDMWRRTRTKEMPQILINGVLLGDTIKLEELNDDGLLDPLILPFLIRK